MKTFIGVCLLLTILLYYWYFNVVDMNSLLEGFTNRYDTFEYNKPYLIVESNKLLCITLEDDDKTISIKPYPTVNPRQLWVPVKEGSTDLRSQPDNRSCNRVTQTKISYNPNEILLKSYHRPDFFLDISYNYETRTFEYKLLKKISNKTTRVINNLDSPIFTGVVEGRDQCTSTNYDCLICTKCHERLTDYTRPKRTQIHKPKVTFHDIRTWDVEGPINVPWVGNVGIPNDIISAVTVHPGTVLWAYQHINYGGWRLYYAVGPNETARYDIFISWRSYGRWGGSYEWDWRNDNISSFIIENHPDNVKTEYPHTFCNKCQLFTGKYNPITCTDETNNIKSMRRYKFQNNELEIIHRISIVGSSSFNQQKQYVKVEDDRRNTMTVSNQRFEFYFVPPNLRGQFYQNYLVRNNLIPRNEPLVQSIEEDVQNYQASQQ